MKSLWLLPLSLGLLSWGLFACSTLPQSPSAPVDGNQVAAEPSSQVGAAADTTDPTAALSVTSSELAFAGDGDTFLAHIEATLQQAGNPTTHRYVSLAGDDGAVWQGELATFSDRTLLFLQAAQSGGTGGFQFSAGPVAREGLLTAISLPQVSNKPLSSPHPTVDFVRARLTEQGVDANIWSFDVTISYPDTGWADYADGWHIETTAGDILGTRVLLHPHVGEQPFTRGLSGVRISKDLTTVLLRSHNLVSGYNPDTVTIPLAVAATAEGYEVIR